MTGGKRLIIGYELPEAGRPVPAHALVAAAQRAELAGVDYLVCGDRPAAPPDGGAGPPSSIVAASLLAARTSRIGLVVEAAPAYYEPYNLARMVASIDHISRGRAGWQVVTGPDDLADANHRREGFDPADEREARAAEFVPLVRDLWDTWEDGAFVHDKATGQFIDGDRVHVLNHIGPTLRVRGPLNLIRPPQGHPVVFAPAADPAVAAAADVLIAGNPAFSAAVTPGPAADSRWVIGEIIPFVAESTARARELHREAGSPSSDAARAVLVGDAGEVTERLLSWADRGVVGGFCARFPLPGLGEAFTTLVLPRLRAAGRLRTAYEATTLRGNLGLRRPENRVAAAAGTEGS